MISSFAESIKGAPTEVVLAGFIYPYNNQQITIQEPSCCRERGETRDANDCLIKHLAAFASFRLQTARDGLRRFPQSYAQSRSFLARLFASFLLAVLRVFIAIEQRVAISIYLLCELIVVFT